MTSNIDEIKYTISDFIENGSSVNNAFNSILQNFSNQDTRQTLSQLIGVGSVGVADPVSEFNPIVFFSFWNGYRKSLSSSKAISFVEPASIFESYLQDTGATPSSMNNANLVITYVFIRFFNSVAPGYRYPPRISAKPGTKYYSPLAETISRLYQVSGVLNSKGAGNYKIIYRDGITSLLNDKKLTEPNTGYIYKLCTWQRNQYFTENPNATNQDYRNFVAKLPELGTWCGCFTPLDESLKSLVETKTSGSFNPECDPLCYNPRALGLYNTFGNGTQQGSKIDCLAQVCVIDNVNVSSYSSTGGVNFNQLCTGCASGGNNGCLCFLNTSEQTVLSSTTSSQSGGMPNQANFKRNCPNATCFEMNSQGDVKEVKCNEENTPATSDVFRLSSNGIAGVENKTNPTNLFWVFVIGIASALVLFFIGVLELELKF